MNSREQGDQSIEGIRPIASPDKSDNEESFYSVLNHSSQFAEEDDHNGPLFTILEIESSRTVSNSEQPSQQCPQHSQRPSIEPAPSTAIMRKKHTAPPILSTRKPTLPIPQSNISLEQSQQEEDPSISMISPSEHLHAPAEADHESSLLHDIECLKFAEVSPQELREIKNKIEVLKNEQSTLQESLQMACGLLQSTKNRNSAVEQELAHYKHMYEAERQRTQQRRGAIEEQLWKLTKPARDAHENRETRFFPQTSPPSPNKSTAFQALKTLYRECSLHDECRLAQTELYEVSVSYNRVREGAKGQDKLFVRVWLNVFPHIENQSKYKFVLKMGTVGEFQEKVHLNSQPCYEVSQIFSAWQTKTRSFSVCVSEIAEKDGIIHCRELLVPLPITHFLEPRGVEFSSATVAMIAGKLLSLYETSINGEKIEEEWLSQLLGSWWCKPQVLLSCLGWQELCMIKIEKGEGKEWRAKVYGKKGSELILGLMEFLTFALMS